MKIWLGVLVASVAAVPLSAQSAADLNRWGKDVARTLAPPRAPLPQLARGCALNPAVAGDGGEAIIGEKGIIGEKRGAEGIIGEKGAEGIIGEKRGAGEDGVAQQGPQVLANRWQSAGFSTFRHVIEGPPGRVKLVLDACTSASGGETVAVYPTDRQGVRKSPRIMFVIATLRGNARSGSLVLPQPPRGQKVSKVPVIVVVENASGRPHNGSYRLTVTR